MQFTVEFQAQHIERVMEAVRREIATPREMFGSIGESLLRVNNDRHARGLAPDGTPWKPIAPSTLAAGNRKGGPLNRSGRMLASFNYQASNDLLRLGFGSGDGLPAVFHNSGTPPYTITPIKGQALKFGGIFRKLVNHPGLPARPLVGFPDSDAQLVAEVVDDHLSSVIARARRS